MTEKMNKALAEVLEKTTEPISGLTVTEWEEILLKALQKVYPVLRLLRERQ